MNKRILHIGDIAGIPQTLSKFQRKFGYTSNTLSFNLNIYNFGLDFYLPQKTFLPNGVENIFKLIMISPHYDVYHFHAYSAGLKGLDLPLWKTLGKTIILHHHGRDIRGKKENYFFKNFSDALFVSTPDLLQYTSNAIWIPNPIDLERLPVTKSTETSGKIKIVHAPTNRLKKGTEYVIKAVKRLKDDGYNADLILVENMPHEKALECFKQADIVIDQLITGWYGAVSIECMSLGKPVCVYIREDLESYMPFNPIVNTSPKNIIENIKLLVEDQALRKKFGDQSRKYVEQMHDANMIAKKVLSLYK